MKSLFHQNTCLLCLSLSVCLCLCLCLSHSPPPPPPPSLSLPPSLPLSLSLSLKTKKDYFDLIESTKIDFDITAISELRLIRGKLPRVQVCLTNYSYEFSPAKANASSTLKYI